MLSFETFELVVRTEPGGSLVLHPAGLLDTASCQRLNEAIIAALRSASTSVEVDLRDAGPAGGDVRRVLRAGAALARHLDVDYRVIGMAI